MHKLIPQGVIKELGDRAKMLQMHAKLLEVHNVLIEKVDGLKDKGYRDELMASITPMIEEMGRQLKASVPTLEQIKTLIPPPHPVPVLPTLDEIVTAIKPHIPKAKDGKSPMIDHALLAKQIQPFLKMPEAKDLSVEITPEMILEALDKAPKGKKLKIDSIEGLDSHFDLLLRRRGLPHGGGDTIDAGSNITITVVNGKKVISSTGGGSLSVLTVTGTVNDSNTSFTVASAPTLVVINGVVYRTTGDSITWTYLAGALTLSQPVGTGGSIYALG